MASTDPNLETFRNRLAMLLVGAFVSCIPLFVFKNIPIENKEIIVYMVGQLSGMALMALGLYFTNKAGQEAVEAKRAELDAVRADNTGKLADAVVAASNATPAAPTDTAGNAADQVAEAAHDKAEEIKDRQGD